MSRLELSEPSSDGSTNTNTESRDTIITALADRWGTPTYLYDLTEVRVALDELRTALPTPSDLYYSLKANPHPDIVASLIAGNCRAEISSSGELEVALAAGADPAGCLHTGPSKSMAELRYAMERGVVRFSVESGAQLAAVDKAAAQMKIAARCLLRVNTGQAVGGGLRMTGRASPFGTDFDQLLNSPQLCRHADAAQVVGLHSYAASGLSDPEQLLAAFTAGVTAAATLHARCGLPLYEVDLGGGFATPYARPGPRPILAPNLHTRMASVLDEYLHGWRDGRPRVAFESGRYLVGAAGDLVTTVIDVKESRGTQFVVLDSGINHIGGLSGLGRLMPAPVLARVLNARAGDSTGPVNLVGPLCTPADVLSRGIELPNLVPGDRLLVPNAGAYGLTAGPLAFLSRPTPVEIVRDGERVVSASAVVLSRESRTPIAEVVS